MAPQLSGRLLVSAPALTDPHFARTVVLVLEHSGAGALGVVLNRPSDVQVALVLPEWAGVACPPHVVFEGGPVEVSTAIALATLRMSAAHELRGAAAPTGWRPIDARVGDIGLLDLDEDGRELGDQISEMRVFAGYAGWTADQLDDEITAGAWYVIEGGRADVFGTEPERLWRQVLRRQRGPVSLMSTYPDDPSDN